MIKWIGPDEYVNDDRRIRRTNNGNWVFYILVGSGSTEQEWKRVYTTTSLVYAWRYLKSGEVVL